MKTSDFDYHLPEELIAQAPVSPRDQARLMVFDSENGEIFHRQFSDLGDYLRPGDVLVLNRSKVIPARILFNFGRKKCELFLLRKLASISAARRSCVRYQVMMKPGKIFKLGDTFQIDDLEVKISEVLEDGTRVVEFFYDGDLDAKLEKLGTVPLPPYIDNSDIDPNEYQTIYAQEKGSVAAPTAGLHFTENLMESLRGMGVEFLEVILHVGMGTFMPVRSENLVDHRIHSEFYELDEKVAGRLNLAKREGRRIIAVGTTSVRVLETCCVAGNFEAGCGETEIFIYPGKHQWQAVDAMITNFHLPKSTLLMLVAAFLEKKGVDHPVAKLFDIYNLAIQEKYRFYSFGDAMMII